MRVLPLLVLLCVAVLSVEALGYKCKSYGLPCRKGKSCVPRFSKPGLACGNRKLLGGCAKLCRFGGNWCPDGKICRKARAGRRCVWRKGYTVRRCEKRGQFCAKGRKCMDCYLRKGLCCRRASLLGYKKYCGVRYRAYGKACGKYRYKKGCWLVGKYCADGKVCRKPKYGKHACVFKKKLPSCRYFGQICGLKNKRSCVPCYNKKGLCCRRRKKLGSCAKHCRYGGKWCPKRTTCRQRIVKGVVTRRCVYIPRCRYHGQSCGRWKRSVCLKCGKHGLCCRKGVTKGKCQKRCRGFGKKCTLKGCRKGFKGWCCKRIMITKEQCKKTCRGLWKYCSKKGCRKGFKGWCCKTKPYITKKQCKKTCKGSRKYCSKSGCGKRFRGWCCKKRPYVTERQCKKTCMGRWKYCSKKGCRKGFYGWCCKRKPYISYGQCKKTCKGRYMSCIKGGCRGVHGWCCVTKGCKGKKYCHRG